MTGIENLDLLIYILTALGVYKSGEVGVGKYMAKRNGNAKKSCADCIVDVDNLFGKWDKNHDEKCELKLKVINTEITSIHDIQKDIKDDVKYIRDNMTKRGD